MNNHLKAIAALVIPFKAMNQLLHPMFYIMHMTHKLKLFIAGVHTTNCIIIIFSDSAFII